jgi:hypothetical protein
MANAAPDGSPMRAATAVAETLTVRESPTMCANSAVASAAQRSANGAIQIVIGDIRDHCSKIFAVSPLPPDVMAVLPVPHPAISPSSTPQIDHISMAEKPVTIRRERIGQRVGQLATAEMTRLNMALAFVMGLAD